MLSRQLVIQCATIRMSTLRRKEEWEWVTIGRRAGRRTMNFGIRSSMIMKTVTVVATYRGWNGGNRNRTVQRLPPFWLYWLYYWLLPHWYTGLTTSSRLTTQYEQSKPLNQPWVVKKPTHHSSSTSRISKKTTDDRQTTVNSLSSASQESQMSSSVQQSSSSSNQRTQYSYNRYTTVQRGDSVYRIAARNGMSAQELARLNNVSVNTPLRPGQQIRVR